MKKSARTISLILASLMLLSNVSCSDSGENSNETTSQTPTNGGETTAGTETETETEFPDKLPEDLNFGGQSVRFLASYTSKSIALTDEDDESDIVNESVWKRNMKIEERIGTKVELVNGTTTGYGEFNGVVMQSVQSGGDDYDVLVGHQRFNINLAADGVMKNLNNVEYLDFDNGAWSRDYIENLGYNGNYYWASGDISIEYMKYIYSMFVNSTLWNTHYSDVSIYDIVKDGNWTLDVLNQYANGAYIDENGDGLADDGDSYGIIMQKGHVLNGMFFAADVKYTDYDDAGKPQIVLNNEHTVDVFNKLHALFYNTTYGRMLENSAFDTLSIDMFASRRLLFCPMTFEFAENEKIRDMEDNFFIIPLPKYDEEQQNYRSTQYDGVPIYGIPITVSAEHLDGIGATLEAMCSMSSVMVIPTYYDKALKNKYSRDAETAEMIDIVHDSVTSDFSFAWGDSVGQLYSIFYDNIDGEEIASKMSSNTKLWNKSIERLLQKLDEKADN